MAQDNTIHQLTFVVKQHVFVNPVNEDLFHFGDPEDRFGNDIVF